ncbi:hypothetical protein QBC32DRAFT_96716 [Pseudoneurospora amorphoporcata]|uniref:Zn(2)-C6 fungal-type domain-containing protein n=1 Tax=Pseudoneurospora amorphoporcata TaxID=241081 RepID=A0AAN6SHR4_9PEZI|nr:hypothetical protein QBC32DRAFT_96716 [Pseudoneurospora amorphoporcata]
MVFCGKPSKGCSVCRKRKIRCDQRAPGCGQCEKRKEECPGYRNIVDLMFRDESDHVREKARRRRRLTVKAPRSPSFTSRCSTTSEPRQASLSLLVPSPIRPTSPTPEAASSEDEDRPPMSPDSGSWPVTPAVAPLYDLSPSCQQQGIAYFFSRYVSVEETTCHHNFSFVFDVWKPASVAQDRQVDGVLASMTAVGLVGLAGVTRSADMMEAAWKSYGTALRLTNHALKTPIEAVKDTTMLSVLILGLFELIAEHPSRMRTVEAFQEHINGAVALAKLRGTAQFETKAGVKMFSMLCQRVMLSCLQSREPMPMPRPLIDLWHAMPQPVQLKGYGGLTLSALPLMHDFLQVRADMLSGALVDSDSILAHLFNIDEGFEQLSAQFSPNLVCKSFRLTRHHPAVLNGVCNVYPTLWDTTLWNSLRMLRMLLLETIICEIQQLSRGLCLKATCGPYADQFKSSKRKLMEMLEAICGSVPQLLGLVDPTDGSVDNSCSTPILSVEVRETPSPPTSPSARSSDSGGSSQSPLDPTRAHCANLTILHPVTPASADAEEEASRFVLLISATSPVVWPLYMVGMSSVCTGEVKSYVVGRLRTLYMETGVKQADAVANLLEEHDTIDGDDGNGDGPEEHALWLPGLGIGYDWMNTGEMEDMPLHLRVVQQQHELFHERLRQEQFYHGGPVMMEDGMKGMIDPQLI